jgi:hypothetical protein
MESETKLHEWQWTFIPLASLDKELLDKLLLDANAEIVEEDGKKGVRVEIRKLPCA